MRRKKVHPHSQSGQTIIEVLIASVVVAMVLTAVAAALTVSVKNTAQSRYQEIARSRAQSGLELYRRERTALGWQAFREVVGDGTYCIDNLPSDTAEFATLAQGDCTTGTAVLGNTFTREARVTTNGPDEIRVDVTSGWQDGILDKEVVLSQIFRRYQNE